MAGIDFSPDGNRELNISQFIANFEVLNSDAMKLADMRLADWHKNWSGLPEFMRPPKPGPVELRVLDADLFRALWAMTGHVEGTEAAFSTVPYYPQYAPPAPPPPVAAKVVVGKQLRGTNVYEVGYGDTVPGGQQVTTEQGTFIKKFYRQSPFHEEKLWYEKVG